MPSRKAWIMGLAIVALGASSLKAQGLPSMPGGMGIPGAGGAIPASAVPGAVAPAMAAAPAARGLCANLGACLAKCRAKLCASQFGQMLNSFTGGPLASVTGGFLPQICPPMSAAQAAALAAAQPGSAAATAAAIQASEADAKARVAAIEYLGTVDCTRWPEAQTALINGLRQDPNECVRFAAARVLNSGCCCNKKVIDALRICVSGEDTDGAPAETSVRVKAAAFSALQNCLMCVPEDLPPEPVPPEPEGAPVPTLTPLPPAPERATRRPAPADRSHLAASYTPTRRRPPTYQERLGHKTFNQTVDEARQTLVQVSKEARPTGTVPSGQRSLFGALSRARQDVNTLNHRRAREQGVFPPGYPSAAGPVPPEAAPAPADAGAVMPASLPSAAGPPPGATGASGMTSDPGPPTDTEPMPAPRPGARRGLIGMMLHPAGD